MKGALPPGETPTCFAPELAVFPTRVVPIALVFDLVEVPHSDGAAKIDAYRRAMAAGDRFPPIAVIPFRGRFLVADGHKRLAACRPLLAGDLVVEVWTIRRWLLDQWRQLARKAGQHARLAVRSLVDEGARKELRRLRLDTVGHWKRIAASAARRFRR